MPERKVTLKTFRNAPFPYRGKIPDSDRDFMDVNQHGRLGHTSPRSGVLWEDQTYNDQRVLLALPKGFDVKSRALIVVFFHGNRATLERDVIGRQAIVDQLEASGLNAGLVAPQMAVDAQDSSAGRFWLPNAFHGFMVEATTQLAALHGAPGAKRAFQVAPIIIVGYSGGYDPAAYAVSVGGEPRVRGVMLFDAVYDDSEKFSGWIVKAHKTSFFFSAYSAGSEPGDQAIARVLVSKHIAFTQQIPDKLGPGVVAFYGTGDDVNHDDYMTDAWQHWPLQSMLSRITGYVHRV